MSKDPIPNEQKSEHRIIVEEKKPVKSLDEVLAEFANQGDLTPTDIMQSLLEQEKAIVHGEIVNPRIMTAIKMYQGFAEGLGFYRSAAVVKVLYDSTILHMVAYKRKRATELVKMFNGLMAFLGMEQPEKRGGLFGSTKKE